MRYRSVFVYSKIIRADKVKNNDGAVMGFLLIVYPMDRYEANRRGSREYYLLINQILLSGIRGPLIFLVPYSYSILKHSLFTPLFTL